MLGETVSSDAVRGAFLVVLLAVATEQVAGGFGGGSSTV